MKILHYDCFAGISGDMNLAALLDLGVDKNHLLQELKKLTIDGYRIVIKNDMRRGISGTKVEVLLETPKQISVLVQSPQSQQHRTFREIQHIITKSTLSTFVKEKSLAIFRKLAEAEGKIHNIATEEVHFHEVGAVDSIVDIVGAAICLDFLKPDKITASAIELGSGTTRCEHGIFPVPAPATIELLKGIPVTTGKVPFEATTPTGAAILATMVNEFTEKNAMKVEKTAYGIGHKDSPVPNVLRVHWYSKEVDNEDAFISETASIVECNIDDMNPEVYDHLMELLFAQGADDVFLTPILMKKSRPAIILSIICKEGFVKKMATLLLTHTSSLGVRTYHVNRFILERESIVVETTFGKVRVKKSWLGNSITKYKAEYNDCSRIANETGLPVYKVMLQINSELGKLE